MKKTLFIVVLCTLYTISVLGQSRKNEELLTIGIKSNDFEKVTKALYGGATPNDGLIKAIELDNLEYTKIFLDKGADPSSALLSAVSQNNISIVEYLLEKGAKFLNDKSYIIEDPSYLIDKENLKNKIPITLSRINGKDCWLMKNEADIKYVKEKGSHFYIEYVIQDSILANNALIYAINNNNLQMVNLLLKHGINSQSYCFAKYLYVDPWISDRATGIGYYMPYYFDGTMKNVVVSIDGVKVEVLNRSSKGVFLSKYTPSLPIITRPVQYAIYKNVDKNILDALLLQDSIPNYKFNIKYVPCIKGNPKISNEVVNTFDYGFTLNFKVKNDNVFGYKILYSIDSKIFKEIKDITFPVDSINNGADFKESITHYYYNMFADSIHPKSVVLKIILKEYGVLIDKNDGEQYKTVKIGDQVLMAENIRYKTDKGCWSGTNKSYDIKKHGYLYDWETANTINIEGWHLPSIMEWEDLFKEMGGFSQFKLHNINGGFYRSEQDGINCAVSLMKEGGSSGFNLTLGGSRTIYAVYEGFGKSDLFWSSTDHWDFFLQSEVQWLRGFNAYKYNAPKKCGCSVRLFKNK